jgi:hypothetical protein
VTVGGRSFRHEPLPRLALTSTSGFFANDVHLHHSLTLKALHDAHAFTAGLFPARASGIFRTNEASLKHYCDTTQMCLTTASVPQPLE